MPLGYTSLWLSILADTGATVLLILNVLLLVRHSHCFVSAAERCRVISHLRLDIFFIRSKTAESVPSSGAVFVLDGESVALRGLGRCFRFLGANTGHFDE